MNLFRNLNPADQDHEKDAPITKLDTFTLFILSAAP